MSRYAVAVGVMQVMEVWEKEVRGWTADDDLAMSE